MEFKIPYLPGSEPWKKRFEEALKKGEKPVEVFVFGTENFKLLKGVPRYYHYGFKSRRSDHAVKIYNEKLGTWQYYPCNEYLDVCPVCGKLMKVFYIPGTTYLACCSEQCYKKYEEFSKSMFGIQPNLPSFSENDRIRFHEE